MDSKRSWFATQREGAHTSDKVSAQVSEDQEPTLQPLSQLEQLSSERDALMKRAKTLSYYLQELQAEIVVADAGIEYMTAVQEYRLAKKAMEEKFRVKLRAMAALKRVKVSGTSSTQESLGSGSIPSGAHFELSQFASSDSD
jgi:hypothetical protein